MFKATITTKGQITIPNKIRNMLNLKEGDVIVFKPLTDKIMVFEKAPLVCPICFGGKTFHEVDFEMDCIFCNGQGILEENETKTLLKLEKMIVTYGRKYGILNKIQFATDIEQTPPCSGIIPQVYLASNVIPLRILKKIRDHYQTKLIEEFAGPTTEIVKRFKPSSGKSFSPEEAQQLIGKKVKSLISFNNITSGTEGVVSEWNDNKDETNVGIVWMKNDGPFLDWFSKSSYEIFLVEDD